MCVAVYCSVQNLLHLGIGLNVELVAKKDLRIYSFKNKLLVLSY